MHATRKSLSSTWTITSVMTTMLVIIMSLNQATYAGMADDVVIPNYGSGNVGTYGTYSWPGVSAFGGVNGQASYTPNSPSVSTAIGSRTPYQLVATQYGGYSNANTHTILAARPRVSPINDTSCQLSFYIRKCAYVGSPSYGQSGTLQIRVGYPTSPGTVKGSVSISSGYSGSKTISFTVSTGDFANGPKYYYVSFAPSGANQSNPNEMWYGSAIKVEYNPAPPPQPTADLDASVTSGSAPLSVFFDATGSQNVTSYSIDFGDGTPAASSSQVTHVYQNAGSYNAVLSVTGPGGSTNDNVFITVTPSAPTASFNRSPSGSVTEGTRVWFTDESTNNPTQWIWDAGAAGNSTQENPSFTFNTVGSHTVTLVASNTGGSSPPYSRVIVVTAPDPDPQPVAVASATPLTGTAPLAVNFNGTQSTDAQTYDWDYKDGSSGSGSTTTHTFTNPGTYDVTLTVANGANSDWTSVQIVVTAPAIPVPAFNATPLNGDEPLFVSFDGSSSTGPINSYEWNWGDGTPNGTGITSSHTYQLPGTYRPYLTVYDTNGTPYSSATQTITVNPVGGNTPSMYALLFAGTYGAGDPLTFQIPFSIGYAYQMLMLRGYPKGNIRAYTENQSLDWDHDNLPDVNGLCTLAEMTNAFNWLMARPDLDQDSQIVIYICNHGNTDATNGGLIYLNASEVLYPSMLKDQILSLLENTPLNPNNILTIASACYSGTFIPEVGSTGVMTLTTTEATNVGYAVGTSTISFDGGLWTRLGRGKSLLFSEQFSPSFDQNPLIDGNGDGVADEPADHQLANQWILGVPTVGPLQTPTITNLPGPQTLANPGQVNINTTVTDNNLVSVEYAVTEQANASHTTYITATTSPMVYNGSDNYTATAEFTAPGDYYVWITATDSDGHTTTEAFEVVVGSPVGGGSANFTCTEDMSYPGRMQFTNTSTNNPSQLKWDFGNGSSYTSSHTGSFYYYYQNTGTYTVTLTATGPSGSSTTAKQITVTQVPHSNFTVTSLGEAVHQFDASSTWSNPSYQWNFGDGATGSGKTRYYIYKEIGTYTVTLTVSSPNGSSTSTRQVTITSIPESSSGCQVALGRNKAQEENLFLFLLVILTATTWRLRRRA